MQQVNYFFSYSRKDSEFVKRLATDLKKEGANVWLDQLDIAPGSPWDDSIQNALNGAQGVIVILSDDSVKSKNVMDEVSYAMTQGKRIVPLIIEDCPVPFRLARLQYIDFMGDYDSSLARLLTTLKTSEISLTNTTTPPGNISSKIESKRNFVKPVVIWSAIILVVAVLIVFILSKKSNNIIDTSTTTAPQNSKTEQASETDDQPATTGTVTEVPSQNVDQNAAPNTNRINLFAPESGTQILVASNDDWKYTIDGKEDWAQINYGVGKEVVYGFKDDRSATFDTFAMLITETADNNIKEFELLAGNNTPLGQFQSVGKFETKNVKLFKTPYQEFKFPTVTAKYLKFKLISTFGYTHPGIHEFQLFGSLK